MEKENFEDLFEKIELKSSFGTSNTIFVDKETGIEYLFSLAGYAGGLTVLVDRDGKPKIHENYR